MSEKRHNYVLTRKCQVNGVLMDPKGKGAFIKNFSDSSIVPCPECIDTPGKNKVCFPCRGSGEVHIMKAGMLIKRPCGPCKGSGQNPHQDCPYCKGTARLYPPHHYKEVDVYGEEIVKGESPDERESRITREHEEKKEKEINEKEKIKQLREELKKGGRDFVTSWGVEKLEEQVVKMKKEKGE